METIRKIAMDYPSKHSERLRKTDDYLLGRDSDADRRLNRGTCDICGRVVGGKDSEVAYCIVDDCPHRAFSDE